MDHLCGRMVYYDEMTSDFAGNDPSKMEYMKQVYALAALTSNPAAR